MPDQNENALSPKSSSSVPSFIKLVPNDSIDLSFLPEEERKALLTDHAKGMIDLGKKAQELHIDAAVLKRTLGDLTETAIEGAVNGNSVTISHTQTTSVGRTEVLMGNTDQAHRGKLTRSQTGEKDFTPYYIFGAIIALLVLAGIFAK